MTTVPGVVVNGVVVPNAPLPEGAHVEIQLKETSLELSPELQEDLKAWQQASAKALALVEQLAQESRVDEKR